MEWSACPTFGTYVNIGNADAGVIKGTQREIACECWFTSSGKIIYLMLKIKDEDREIRTWLIYYQTENCWVLNFR